MSTSLLTVGDYISVTMVDSIDREVEIVGIVEEVVGDMVLIYWGTSDNTRHSSLVVKEKVNEWSRGNSNLGA